MSSLRYLIAFSVALIGACGAHAGLYYSREVIADLPSQWSGFLLDQRILRNIALQPTARTPASPARKKYQNAIKELEKQAQERKLDADEQADLGALLLRLGEVDRALDVLRSAQREHPRHFHINANLGTTWQMQGDLAQAASCLREAVALAPTKHKRTEEFHLKLVQSRRNSPPNSQTLDDLFGIRYVGDDGEYQPGRLSDRERKQLPADAVAIVQQLALWFPADGRLLWQLAELANAYGDVRIAAAMMDGCVKEFSMGDPELRRHRRALRDVAEEVSKLNSAEIKAKHESHLSAIEPRSKRPLQTRLDQQALPPLRADGVNPLPWWLLAETNMKRGGKPTFAKRTEELDGRQVELVGFMQPLDEDPALSAFLLVEYPIGCWFCEMPDVTGIVMVALGDGQTTPPGRNLVKIVGRLKLNATEPESFLYTIANGRVMEAD